MVEKKKMVDQRHITSLFLAGLLLILISMKSFAEKHGIHNAFWVKTPPGGCLLFPSHIDHWVDQNKSTKDRISISFNLELNY